MAIGIKVKKMDGKTDPGVSKFFGDPTIPAAWAEKWSDDVIFFCQIKLSDMAALDTQNRLPHTGYLYIFLDVEVYPYTPMVYYYDGEPDMMLDDFNEVEPTFAHLTEGFKMEFSPVSDDADGIKLFGVPADWSYDEPAPKLLMQFDPLAADMGFLDNIDGYAYFFFGKDEKDLDEVNFHIEHS